jgi:hypothetical protein
MWRARLLRDLVIARAETQGTARCNGTRLRVSDIIACGVRSRVNAPAHHSACDRPAAPGFTTSTWGHLLNQERPRRKVRLRVISLSCGPRSALVRFRRSPGRRERSADGSEAGDRAGRLIDDLRAKKSSATAASDIPSASERMAKRATMPRHLRTVRVWRRGAAEATPVRTEFGGQHGIRRICKRAESSRNMLPALSRARLCVGRRKSTFGIKELD